MKSEIGEEEDILKIPSRPQMVLELCIVVVGIAGLVIAGVLIKQIIDESHTTPS